MAQSERHPRRRSYAPGWVVGSTEVAAYRAHEQTGQLGSYLVRLCSRLRERGILTDTDGPHHSVLKLRPPLIFSE